MLEGVSHMVYYLPNRSMAQTADGPGGERKAEENPLQWTRSFAIMLAAATVIAIALNFLSLYYREKKDEVLTEEPASKVIVVPARPSTAPTPTPAIGSLRLYAAGGELGEDGFTMYVEDRPLEITAVMEPKLTRPPIYWSVSDDKAATLTVSDDRTSCKFSAIKPAGKIELTVSCYGTETVIPVYLWNR
jgi:hypothetical protein